MKKKFYKLQQTDNAGNVCEYILSENGKPVILPDFPELECFSECSKVSHNRSYNISECRTGQKLYYGGWGPSSLKDAIMKANDLIKHHGVEKVERACKIAEMNYGLSPWTLNK